MRATAERTLSKYSSALTVEASRPGHAELAYSAKTSEEFFERVAGSVRDVPQLEKVDSWLLNSPGRSELHLAHKTGSLFLDTSTTMDQSGSSSVPTWLACSLH